MSILVTVFANKNVNALEFAIPVVIQDGGAAGAAWDGEIAFGLWNFTSGPISNSYLVVMKTNGTVEYLRESPDPSYEDVKNIAQDTLMFQGEPGSIYDEPTHFWNYTSNALADFPSVRGHHEVEYNPINNTFLNLRAYVRTVGDNRVLYDLIVEEDASGNILWSWDTYDYVPLSQADPFNITTTWAGETVIDLTHSNAVQWDYNNSIAYLNVRHTNTFYKINMTSGDVIWACGQFGNFTLLNEQGNPVTSLWYHSHGTRMVEPGVFAMFDNDFNNITNPNNCRSRMIEVTVDEQNMTAWVSWSWEAPTQYWTPYFGKTDRLPNGDRIGVFGSNTHHFPQNQPWPGNDTGAVLVEVNSTGTVVRTWTFPPGWAIYRIDEITSQSSVPVVLPKVATPTFNPIGGTYSSPQSVTLSCSTATATIRYTTDGSEPSSSSAMYISSSSISITSTATIKAKAFASGMTASDTATAVYTITTPNPEPQLQKVSTPTFSPAGGTYSSPQNVVLACVTSDATIQFTVDGSEPSSSSTVYSSPILVSATTTIKAKAYASGMTASDTASATYTISAGEKVATPTFSPAGGQYSSAQSVVIQCATSGAVIHYTTDGVEPSSSSLVYSSPILINATTTIKAKASMNGIMDSDTASATYTISTGTSSQNPLFGNAEAYVAVAIVVIIAAVGGLLFYLRRRKRVS